MEKQNSHLEHGQPMEHTRGLYCMCDSGVARCQTQHQYHFLPYHNTSITSYLANELDVRSVLDRQVSLAAVYQMLCNS